MCPGDTSRASVCCWELLCTCSYTFFLCCRTGASTLCSRAGDWTTLLSPLPPWEPLLYAFCRVRFGGGGEWKALAELSDREQTTRSADHFVASSPLPSKWMPLAQMGVGRKNTPPSPDIALQLDELIAVLREPDLMREFAPSLTPWLELYNDNSSSYR